jgi:hypothetical protein
VTYVDRLRAMCSALSIGAAGELVTEESMQHAVQAFQRGIAFKWVTERLSGMRVTMLLLSA